MICKKCGNTLNTNEQFCGNCGYQLENTFIKNDNIQKKNIENKIKITTIILVLLIISAIVIGVIILKEKKPSNLSNNSKYIINISYDERGKINLNDATSKTYYYPDSSDFKGQSKIIEVFKINDYVSIYKTDSFISNPLEFIIYNEEDNKEHLLDSFGYLSSNIGEFSILTDAEKRVYEMDYDYDKDEINTALKTAPSIHDVALKYSKDEDNISYAINEPSVKKINENISRVDITQSWGEVDYNFFINFDDNEYFIVTISCDPDEGCNLESDELLEVLNTFEKIEFNVNK